MRKNSGKLVNYNFKKWSIAICLQNAHKIYTLVRVSRLFRVAIWSEWSRLSIQLGVVVCTIRTVPSLPKISSSQWWSLFGLILCNQWFDVSFWNIFECLFICLVDCLGTNSGLWSSSNIPTSLAPIKLGIGGIVWWCSVSLGAQSASLKISKTDINRIVHRNGRWYAIVLINTSTTKNNYLARKHWSNQKDTDIRHQHSNDWVASWSRSTMNTVWLLVLKWQVIGMCT